MTDSESDSVHVAGLVGSQATESATRVAVERALTAADAGGATTDLIDPRGLELPLYDSDRSDAGDAETLCRRLRAADAVVLGTPMYHGSYSSVVKTMLDYAGFDEFDSVTVGLLAVSGGSFPITALDHLRSVLRSLNAWVLPYQAAVPNSHAAVSWGENSGRIDDQELADRVATLGQRVIEYADIEPNPVSFEGAQNQGAD